MKKILLTLLFISLLNIHFSKANENSDFAKQIFNELDINHDGVIDTDDIKNFSKKEFNSMDKNKNNAISKEEFFDFVCEKSCNHGNCECKSHANMENLDYLNNYWLKVDKNSDKQITFQEKFESDLDNFYNLDTNADDKITKEELEEQLD